MLTPRAMVVVVDDDHAVLKAMARLLRAGGFDPVAYSSAEQFLASPPDQLPVCLVLDVRLGGMSGLDLHRRLRTLGSSLSVIVMTAVDDDAVRREAHELGCAAFLTKDTEADVLLNLIQTLASSTRPAAR